MIDRETDKARSRHPGWLLRPRRSPIRTRRLTAFLLKTGLPSRFTFHVPPGEQHVYIMDGMSSSSLGRRDLFVPEQGEIESCRLLRTAPENHGSRDMIYRKAEIRPQPPAGAKFKDVMKVEARAAKSELPVRDPAKGKVTEEMEEPTPKVRTITGHVRDPKGRPVVGVKVYVNPRPGEPFERFDSAATDRDGMFLLNGLPHLALLQDPI